MPYMAGSGSIGFWSGSEEEQAFQSEDGTNYLRTTMPVYDGPPNYDHQQDVKNMAVFEPVMHFLQ